MRDIRLDLRDRLAAVLGRYADEMADYNRQRTALEQMHATTIESLDRERGALEQLLSIEDKRPGVTPSDSSKPARLVASLGSRLP